MSDDRQKARLTAKEILVTAIASGPWALGGQPAVPAVPPNVQSATSPTITRCIQTPGSGPRIVSTDDLVRDLADQKQNEWEEQRRRSNETARHLREPDYHEERPRTAPER